LKGNLKMEIEMDMEKWNIKINGSKLLEKYK
jgi:hypothetical protein